jgi:hypothetical protein
VINRDIVNMPAVVPKLQVYDWVAVSYDNGWYPGQVVQIADDDTVIVNFIHPCSLVGQYKYPSTKDTVPVKRHFIFACPLEPSVPKSGGRIFHLPKSQELTSAF